MSNTTLSWTFHPPESENRKTDALEMEKKNGMANNDRIGGKV